MLVIHETKKGVKGLSLKLCRHLSFSSLFNGALLNE